ncbi:anti-phage protein KwaB [Flavobacterium xanthum]|uniref:DUF4868 domain-containing protein n=1 Tax=Flavobacterium xanthum TaxID=69322 RepID=A0A1M7CRS0_9FLAO|nr:anti-phage protein KwaB [Flavobacterium xanthum]SHL69867.1 protein of unknown function [Flavobacterium xanthum]
MNLEEIKEKLHSICEMEGIGINVYFLLKAENNYVLKRANIIENVKTTIISSYKNSLNSIIQNEDLALLNLSAADDRIHAFYKYDLEETPGVFNFFEEITNPQNQIPYFSFDLDELADLEGYFVYFGDHANNVLFYRKQMSVNLFKQGKIYLIKGHETQFTSIDEEFLRIDGKIDVLKIEAVIYINNIDILERHYEFRNIIINEATASIENISALQILENIEVLSERINDVAFARKLSKISTTSPVFQLPKETIMNFVRGHLTLGHEFRYSQDGTKILLDTKKSQNFFLRLMNDDFLHSQLTDYDYVTPAKDKL